MFRGYHPHPSIHEVGQSSMLSFAVKMTQLPSCLILLESLNAKLKKGNFEKNNFWNFFFNEMMRELYIIA
jgi:hypothetical protein